MTRLRLRFQTPQLILAAFVVVATLYSVTMPIFEASDEYLHFPVVKQIADGLGLPVQRPGERTAWAQEGSQPPLYYLLVSPLARWIDTRDMAERLRYNPHAHPGDPYLDANRNLIVHSTAENFPWRQTTLAVHLIRFVSIVLGAVTIAATGALAREVAPRRPDLAISAMALTAFNPMFLFITASVNNDNLVIALSTLALVLIAQILNEQRGARREAETQDKRWIIRRTALAVVIGLACLTKVSGLALLAPAAIALSITHLGRRERGRWIGSGLLLVAGVVVVAGWWYARNWTLYGEWLGIETMAQIAGLRSQTPSLIELAAEFEGFKIAYWALFGAVNILTFPLAYVFFDGLTLLAAVGLALRLRQLWRAGPRSELWPWLICLLYVLTLFLGVVRWTAMTPASQGRLLFPGIAAISTLIGLGWHALWDQIGFLKRSMRRIKRKRRYVAWSVAVAMPLIAVQVPFADILPTYATPPFLQQTDLPNDLRILNVTFDDHIRLIGVAPSRQITPDGRLSFTVYWQCLASMRQNYSVFVSVKGRRLAEVGKRDAYPYRGLLATNDCPAGAIFADPYRLPIDPAAQRPTVLRAHIGLMDWPSRRLATIADGAGNPIPSLFVEAGALPPDIALRVPPLEMGAAFDFGGVIQLAGYTLVMRQGVFGGLGLALHWIARQPPTEDYTVFIHLLDDQGSTVAQWDAQPLDGDYPTSWWQPGVAVLDERVLPLPANLPAGEYRLALGLYGAPAGPRLPVRDASNAPLPDDRVLIRVQVDTP